MISFKASQLGRRADWSRRDRRSRNVVVVVIEIDFVKQLGQDPSTQSKTRDVTQVAKAATKTTTTTVVATRTQHTTINHLLDNDRHWLFDNDNGCVTRGLCQDNIEFRRHFFLRRSVWPANQFRLNLNCRAMPDKANRFKSDRGKTVRAIGNKVVNAFFNRRNLKTTVRTDDCFANHGVVVHNRNLGSFNQTGIEERVNLTQQRTAWGQLNGADFHAQRLRRCG